MLCGFGVEEVLFGARRIERVWPWKGEGVGGARTPPG